MAPLPLDLFGGAAASDGTYAYYFGGYSFSTIQTVNTAYRYDPVADTLDDAGTDAAGGDRRPRRSTTRRRTRSTSSAAPTAMPQLVFDITQVYDIASNSWSMGPTMPAPRSQMARGYNPPTARST